VTGFFEKRDGGAPCPDLVNTGVYIIRKPLVLALPPDQEVSLERDVFPVEASGGRIAAHIVPMASFFIDIGVPDDYARAQTEVLAARTRPALFLDRDGTLNRDEGYTHRPESLEWLPGAREAVKLANARGYYVFVVSNQAGVARGFYREEDVLAFHRAMQVDLFEIGGHVDALEYCPHHEEGTVHGYALDCRRRKPKPGMIEDLLGAWPVDAARSVLVGNAESDVQAGRAAGLRSVIYRGSALSDLVAELITD
jgi:D-glycero-D-manno-heptose 1,7-bisphosphate phosphatase